MLHKDSVVSDGIHIIQAWQVADAAALAALAPVIAEIGKVAYQVDTKKFWVLENNVGPVWRKLNTADTADVPEGTNLYFSTARVLATVLAGLSTATGTVVTAGHTILQAIGFLQKQVSDNTTAIAALGGGGGGSGPTTPDTIPTSPNVADDEFQTGAPTLDTGGTRATGATPWTWRNQGGATAVLNKGNLLITAPANGSLNNFRWVEQALPGSGTWKYRAKMHSDCPGANDTACIGLFTSGTGKLIMHGMVNNANVMKNFVGRYTNATTFSATIFAATDFGYRIGYGYKYLEIEWDGTNYIFRVSANGNDGTWIQLCTELPASFLGTPDKIWVGTNAFTTQSIATFEWFRRVA